MGVWGSETPTNPLYVFSAFVLVYNRCMGGSSRVMVLFFHLGVMFFGTLLMGGALILIAQAADMELSGLVAYPAGFTLFHLLLRALRRVDDIVERRAATRKDDQR